MIRDGLAGNVKGHLINSTGQVDEGLHPYVSLMEALESIFSCMNYESCLLTVECNTVAIFKISNTFFLIFDSHSRNVWGQFDTSGTAVQLRVLLAILKQFILTKQLCHSK